MAEAINEGKALRDQDESADDVEAPTQEEKDEVVAEAMAEGEEE